MNEIMMNHPYNGWENKFTWLVHLHLSNEEHLMNEITELVASEPNDGAVVVSLKCRSGCQSPIG